MKHRVRTVFRLIVAAQFLLTALGIPLYQHLCSATGLYAPLSACSMHEEAADGDCCTDIPEECCADDAGRSLPPAVSVSQGGPGGAHCCVDIDVTPVVKDAYTGAVRVMATIQVSPWVAPLPTPLPSSPLPGSTALVFCDSSPPSGPATRLLLSSLLM